MLRLCLNEPSSFKSVTQQALCLAWACSWENLSLGYTEAPGNPILRQEISTTYENTSADNVVVVAPEEGIYLTLKALLKPGDHVVVTYPGYQSLCEVARSIGCRLTYWRVTVRSDWNLQWTFDLQELESLIKPDTKVRPPQLSCAVNPCHLHFSVSCSSCS